MLGLQPYIAPHINSRLFLIPTILGMAAALCLALALMLRDRLVPAGVLSLGCGVALGVVAACVAQRPLPADHVLRRIAAGTVGLSTPLRWHGTLRSEPAKLPRRGRVRQEGISGGSGSAGGDYSGGRTESVWGILFRCCCSDWMKAVCGCCERAGKARFGCCRMEGICG